MNWIFNKNTLTIMLSVITSSAFAASVDTFPFPSKPRWKTRIVFNDGTMLNGFTTAKTDSTITLIIAQPDSLGQPRAVTIPFTDVKKIKMRDKYAWSVTQNMLVGAGIGFLLGFALSVQDCDDPDSDCTFIESFFSDSKFENAVKLGTTFSIIGLGAGGLASDKVTFKFKLGKDRKQKPKLPIL